MQGQQFSAVLPNQQANPLDTFMQLKQYQDRQSLIDEQRQRQERERQDYLLKWAQDQLDFKNFATGTVLDQTIVSTLGEGIKALAQRIAENPDMSSASLLYDAQSIASDVTQYSNKAKQIRSSIDALAKEYSKNPSLDAAALAKGAITSAFMKYDPKSHSMVIKDPSEIDESVDYVSNYLNEHPENVVTGNKAFMGLLKSSEKRNYEKEVTTDQKGVKRTLAYKGEVYPFNELVGQDGKPIDENGVATGIRIKSKPYQLPNGQSFDIADDNSFEYFMSDPGSNAYFNAQVKKIGYDPNSEEGEVVKKRLLYEQLNVNNPGYINNTKNQVNEDTWHAKLLMGLLKAGGNSSSSSDQKRIINSPLTGVIAAIGGNKSFIGDLKETDPQGNELLNITPYIPTGAIFSGKIKKNADGTASKEAYAGVLLDPNTNTLVLKDVKGYKMKNGIPVTDNLGNKVLEYSYERVPVEKEKSLFEQLGEANNLSKDEAAQIYNQILGGRVQERQVQNEAEQRLNAKPNSFFKYWDKLMGK